MGSKAPTWVHRFCTRDASGFYSATPGAVDQVAKASKGNPGYLRDLVAVGTDPVAYDGVDLFFYYAWPQVDDIEQNGFEVPIEGVSANGSMYVYFSTDEAEDIGRPMGRTVLARLQNEPQLLAANVQPYFASSLYTLSTDKFINVSIEVVLNAKVGAPSLDGKGLLIWGSGRYRGSDVYLAWMPLAEIENKASLRYFAGLQLVPALVDRYTPVWSEKESDAVSLFCAGDIGELSVRWNHFLKRWVCLYNGASPPGIVLRTAEQPWGLWTEPPMVLYDPARPGTGYCEFMHANAPCPAGSPNPADVDREDGKTVRRTGQASMGHTR